MMEIRMFVETVFESGEVLTHDVGQICRTLDDAGHECLGLHLDEAKRVAEPAAGNGFAGSDRRIAKGEGSIRNSVYEA